MQPRKRIFYLLLINVNSHILLLAKSLQSCPTLCNSLDCSLPSSSVHGILQAGILEWLPFPSPGDLLDPGIKPRSSVSPALAEGFFTTSATWKAHVSLVALVLDSLGLEDGGWMMGRITSFFSSFFIFPPVTFPSPSNPAPSSQHSPSFSPLCYVLRKEVIGDCDTHFIFIHPAR